MKIIFLFLARIFKRNLHSMLHAAVSTGARDGTAAEAMSGESDTMARHRRTRQAKTRPKQN